MTDNEALNAIAAAIPEVRFLLSCIAFGVIWLYGGFFWKLVVYIKNHREFWGLLLVLLSPASALGQWSYTAPCHQSWRFDGTGLHNDGDGTYSATSWTGPGAKLRIWDATIGQWLTSSGGIAIGTPFYMDCGEDCAGMREMEVYVWIPNAADGPDVYVYQFRCTEHGAGPMLETYDEDWVPLPSGLAPGGNGMNYWLCFTNAKNGVGGWNFVGTNTGWGMPGLCSCGECAPGDMDCDGQPDNVDCDDDGDGTPDVDEDDDGDGTPNDEDWDDDQDGILDNEEGEDDDGDGRPNCCDGDDDNDGVPDFTDCDWHGKSGGCCNDDDPSSGDPGSTLDPYADPDGDGVPNYLDIDDDNDGILDVDDPDSDGNGITDSTQDWDEDGIPDLEDTDIDGDGVPGTGLAPPELYPPAPTPPDDSDEDEIYDHVDEDDDGDGIPDDEDSDDDGDGIPDTSECIDWGSPGTHPPCCSCEDSEDCEGLEIDGCEFDPSPEPGPGGECECCDELVAALGDIARDLDGVADEMEGARAERESFEHAAEPGAIGTGALPPDIAGVTQSPETAAAAVRAAPVAEHWFSTGLERLTGLSLTLGTEGCAYTYCFSVPLPGDEDHDICISTSPTVNAALFPAVATMFNGLNVVRQAWWWFVYFWMTCRAWYYYRTLLYDIFA